MSFSILTEFLWHIFRMLWWPNGLCNAIDSHLSIIGIMSNQIVLQKRTVSVAGSQYSMQHV